MSFMHFTFISMVFLLFLTQYTTHATILKEVKKVRGRVLKSMERPLNYETFYRKELNRYYPLKERENELTLFLKYPNMVFFRKAQLQEVHDIYPYHMKFNLDALVSKDAAVGTLFYIKGLRNAIEMHLRQELLKIQQFAPSFNPEGLVKVTNKEEECFRIMDMMKLEARKKSEVVVDPLGIHCHFLATAIEKQTNPLLKDFNNSPQVDVLKKYLDTKAKATVLLTGLKYLETSISKEIQEFHWSKSIKPIEQHYPRWFKKLIPKEIN